MSPIVGVVAGGLAILVVGVFAFTMSMYIVPHGAVRVVSAQFSIPFAPAGFLGKTRAYEPEDPDERGWCGPRRRPRSAMVIWWLIWACMLIAAFWMVAVGSSDALQSFVRAERLTASSVLIAAAWACTAFWPYFYTKNQYWAYWTAAALLLLAALLGLVALAVMQPWADGHPATAAIVGLAYSLFTGWVCVAATLSTCVALVSDGRRQISDADDETWLQGFIPIVLSGTLCLFAICTGDPVLTLPYAWALLFTPGIDRNWKLWTAAGICALGSVAGGLVILAYQHTARAEGGIGPPSPSPAAPPGA